MIRAQARVFIPPPSVTGEYFAAPLIGMGDAVFDASDSSWSGTDCTTAIRAQWLIAVALGLRFRMPPGYFIYTDSLVRTGEAFDGCAFMGTPDRTFLIPKTTGNGQAVNLRHLNFNGTLAADGVGTASPTYYMTSPAVQQADSIQVNLVDYAVGQKFMLCDYGNPILAYHRATAGQKVSNQGQVVEATAISPPAPSTFTISSGTYDGTAGTLTLTTTATIDFGVGVVVDLSGLTGAGDATILEGSHETLTGTTGTTVIVEAELDLDPATTITSGTVTYGAAGPNLVTVKPSLEFNYSGTSTNPGADSTVLRRFTSCPKGVEVSDLIWEWDRTLPIDHRQSRVVFDAVCNVKTRNLRILGPGIGLNYTNGTHEIDNQDIHFADGGPLTYNINYVNGAGRARNTNVTGSNCRHLIQGGGGLTTIEAHDIVSTHCQGWGYQSPVFAGHPGMRNMLWVGCQAWGGKGVSSGGFQFRGRNMRADASCSSWGNYYGVIFAFGTNNYFDGMAVNNVVGVLLNRSPNSVVSSLARIENSTRAHIQYDQSNLEVPFATPYVGMSIGGTYRGVPSIADVVHVLRNANYAPVCDATWTFNLDTPGRVPTFLAAVPTTFAASNYAFPNEWSYGYARKAADFTVTARKDVYYEIDTTAAAVSATLIDPALCSGTYLTLKKVNTGGNTATVIGVVDGTTDPTLSDLVPLRLKSTAQSYPIASGTYNTVNGLVILTMSQAVPFGINTPIILSALTGTGSVASVEGTYTTIATTSGKQVRCTVTTGLGAITITGGTVASGGWEAQ